MQIIEMVDYVKRARGSISCRQKVICFHFLSFSVSVVPFVSQTPPVSIVSEQ